MLKERLWGSKDFKHFKQLGVGSLGGVGCLRLGHIEMLFRAVRLFGVVVFHTLGIPRPTYLLKGHF